MKVVLHIFIFFLMANTFAVSIIEDCFEREDITEMSTEEGEDDSEEEENSDDKTHLKLDFVPSIYFVAVNQNSSQNFMDQPEIYSYLFANIPFSPPKMIG